MRFYAVFSLNFSILLSIYLGPKQIHSVEINLD